MIGAYYEVFRIISVQLDLYRGTTMNLASNNVLSSNEARVISPIEGEMNHLENRISNLFSCIGNVRSRLGTVLAPERKAGDGSAGAAPREIDQSAMHGQLRVLGDQLEDLARELDDITIRFTL